MFKKDFIWGAASAAYQIEGGAFEDGKGLSVWDVFSHQPGNVFWNHNGDVACDHYHKYKEDIALFKKLGIKNYRFSVSWPRIIPNGIGEINPKGIEFYNNLIDELLANGITPYMTLFHWDTPKALDNMGGWRNPAISDYFEEYARVIAENFGDRVKYFMTLNEPQSFMHGYRERTGMPPTAGFPICEMVPTIHNVLMAHGKAAKVLRELVPDAKIGLAPCGNYFYPLDENNPSDIEAARQLTMGICQNTDDLHWNISWYSDPIYLGSYPAEQLEVYGKYLPDGWEDDLKTICQPLDFCGQNVYGGYPATMDENGKPKKVELPAGWTRLGNPVGTPVTPKSLKWATIFLYERYKLPILVCENGMACTDTVSVDGKVHDPQRIDYLHRYIKGIKEATEMGVDIMGYFVWSVMDVFEWSKGYTMRLGLIYVNYETLERIPKDSAYWYKELMETNAENL